MEICVGRNGMRIEVYIREIQFFMILLLCLIVVAGVLLYKKKKLTDQIFCMLLIFMGCVMRIGYTMYTGCELRGHDIGYLTADYPGKAGYVLSIFQTGKLPQGYELQLYQQPLYFIVGAGFSKVINLITGIADPYVLVDAAKYVSCVASCLTLPIFLRLCEAFAMKGKSKIRAVALVAFTPIFYQSAGRLGEESFITFFMVAALLVTLKWEQNHSLKNTMLLAFIYGLGMMTKISMALPAIYTAYILIHFFIKEKDNRRDLFIKYCIFGVISLPIGLWFNIRNLVRFGQPLGYVLEAGTNSVLYRGEKSLAARFLGLDIGNLLLSPYNDVLVDVNMPTYLLKGALFGEFSFNTALFIPVILLFLHIVLTCYLLYRVCVLLCKKEKGSKDRLIAFLYLFGLLFAFVSYIRYSYSCTMDYRYFSYLVFLKALLLGNSYDYPENGVLLALHVRRKVILDVLLALFSIFSILMFVTIAK